MTSKTKLFDKTPNRTNMYVFFSEGSFKDLRSSTVQKLLKNRRNDIMKNAKSNHLLPLLEEENKSPLVSPGDAQEPTNKENFMKL